MKRWPLLALALSVVIVTLAACDVRIKPPAEVESLDVVLLGTYGYTTFEEFGRTIEDYDATLEYDSGRLPDTQTDFRLTLPVAFHNQGRQSWYDALAEIQVTIIAPDGAMASLVVPMREASVQHRRAAPSGRYLVKETASALERRLAAGDRRVLFFETRYVPLMPGIHSVLVELHSKGLTGPRLSRSAFTFLASEPTSGIIAAPQACSITVSCPASERCCSKGTDVPLERRQGHCAPTCAPGEAEMPHTIAEY
jgi:hypothetical protein